MERHDAEENLRVIRSLMEKATIYRAISAPTALVGGLLATTAGALMFWPFRQAASDHRVFFAVWMVVLGITGVANVYFVRKDAKRRGERFISPGMKMALLALFPSHLTAAFATIIAFGLAEGKFTWVEAWMYRVLPGIWCILYGFGMLATAHFAPRSIWKLGWCFLLFGLLFLTWTLLSQPLFFGAEGGRNAHGLMGLTFGLFHVIYATCTWPRAKATEGAKG